jgi:tetratricopeptide (TPR) repeat protein
LPHNRQKVKKQQFILVGFGIVLLTILFFVTKTSPPESVIKTKAAEAAPGMAMNFDELLKHAKERLTPQQSQKVSALENSVVRGDVKGQQVAVYHQLASFWKDTAMIYEPYVYYTAEAAKLENSEKSLTFAAHLFLNSLKTEGDPAMQHWYGENAKVLFEKALEINPANDSSQVGLGACYILGNISDNPMTGIAPVLKIVQKDPGNVFAQFILGLGGVKSGQYEKAIERFKVVVDKQPNNIEALINLAEAYELNGDNKKAVEWYQVVQQKVPNAELRKVLDERIRKLQ